MTFDAIARHRFSMFVDMGFTLDERRLHDTVGAWLQSTIPAGVYRRWLAETEALEIVAGAGGTILPWPPGPWDFSGFSICSAPQRLGWRRDSGPPTHHHGRVGNTHHLALGRACPNLPALKLLLVVDLDVGHHHRQHLLCSCARRFPRSAMASASPSGSGERASSHHSG